MSISDVDVSLLVHIETVWAVEQRLQRMAAIAAEADFTTLPGHRRNDAVEVDHSNTVIEGVSNEHPAIVVDGNVAGPTQGCFGRRHSMAGKADAFRA